MKRGIVIGKFYPPHKGHKYLIEQGCAQVDQLTVIVCDHKSQKIPAQLRAAWLKAMVPQVQVMVVDDCLAEDDSKGWAEYTIKMLGYAPNVVFTSEDYGDAYADFMGAKHVQVDKERRAVSIAARQIRSGPLKYWDYLEPCVRGYFAKRVCVLGAESSGTTTMAQALAEHFKTLWVPEFGHEYSIAKIQADDYDRWDTDEFIFIGNRQNAIEDAMARQCNKILICDTDSFATSLWHERYMGFISYEVEALSKGRHYDMYFLTDVDIPFIQDGTRDGEHIRQNMHRRFEEELKKKNKPYTVLSGSHETRVKIAIYICDRILKKVEVF
jgi:NadR type nicotinamide-nucleotide adenylyltransferase